jgi:hypothetical protein
MNESLTRRTFARDLIVSSVAGVTILPPLSAKADDDKHPVAADQLLAMLRARFPDRLNEEQWNHVRSKIEGQLRAAEELRKFKLTNANEPATVFAAYRRS